MWQITVSIFAILISIFFGLGLLQWSFGIKRLIVESKNRSQ
ncbi:hypothetical protein X953_01405 [Virgibacillus sp. SK37]|nr:hypothetical protein X953_01405 [Virgibacillus sp. SK37]